MVRTTVGSGRQAWLVGTFGILAAFSAPALAQTRDARVSEDSLTFVCRSAFTEKDVVDLPFRVGSSISEEVEATLGQDRRDKKVPPARFKAAGYQFLRETSKGTYLHEAPFTVRLTRTVTFAASAIWDGERITLRLTRTESKKETASDPDQMQDVVSDATYRRAFQRIREHGAAIDRDVEEQLAGVTATRTPLSPERRALWLRKPPSAVVQPVEVTICGDTRVLDVTVPAIDDRLGRPWTWRRENGR